MRFNKRKYFFKFTDMCYNSLTYVYNSLTGVTIHLHVLQFTCMCYNSLTCVTIHLHVLQFTYMCYDSLTCVTIHLHVLQFTYMCYNSLTCVTIQFVAVVIAIINFIALLTDGNALIAILTGEFIRFTNNRCRINTIGKMNHYTANNVWWSYTEIFNMFQLYHVYLLRPSVFHTRDM